MNTPTTTDLSRALACAEADTLLITCTELLRDAALLIKDHAGDEQTRTAMRGILRGRIAVRRAITQLTPRASEAWDLVYQTDEVL